MSERKILPIVTVTENAIFHLDTMQRLLATEKKTILEDLFSKVIMVPD